MLSLVFSGVWLSTVPCPVTCRCFTKDDDNRVICRSSYWHTMPRLPTNTTFFRFYDFEMRELPTNAFESSADTLTVIKLGSAQLQSINQYVFNGVDNLQTLFVNKHKLQTLPLHTFSNLTKLTILDLSYNQIQDLPLQALCSLISLESLHLPNNRINNIKLPTCFENLSQLKLIDMSNNPLGTIAAEDLLPLRNVSLRTLSLRKCKLEKVSPQMFKYLQELTQIDLSENVIKQLSDDVFLPLHSLKVLLLTHNQLGTFSPTYIHTNHGLHTLIIKQNHITTLSESVPQGLLHNIKHLDVAANKLQHLSNYTFHKLHLDKLEKLSLSECSLSTIEAMALVSLPCLEDLNLRDNALTAASLETGLYGLQNSPLNHLDCSRLKLVDLSSSTFRHLVGNNITQLQIDTSRIKFLRTGVFTVFKQVQLLSLQNNVIIYLEDNVFEPLINLEILNLQNNQLTSFPDVVRTALPATVSIIRLHGNSIKKVIYDDLKHLNHVEGIDLTSNNIDTLGRKAFQAIPWITHLNLNYNRIGSLRGSFSYITNLKTLSILGNVIEYVDANAFNNLTELQELDLSKNEKLGLALALNRRLFQYLISLRTLFLNYVGLTDLTDIFQGLTELRELKLSNNHIHALHKDDFRDQVNLEIIWLNDNKISNVPEASFSSVLSLQQLYISSNTFACNCDLLWFMQWIRSGEISLADYSNSSYQCASPDKLNKTPLLDYNLTPDMCISHTLLIILTSVGSVVTVIICVATLVYRYRWYIRYYWFLLRSRKQRLRNDDEAYHFDAFISYMHRDRAFVIEQLLPELEYRGGLHLCLHDRNWLAGADIADNIIESIESSRRTVLVVSNDFARSEWCQLEMALAHTNMLQMHRDSLVLILLEDIDPEFASARLRSLLTEKTYLSWSDDPQEQDYFWEGLKRVLKRPEQNL